jgi:23S rRNA (uracil1939-C5)-methyltransferase
MSHIHIKSTIEALECPHFEKCAGCSIPFRVYQEPKNSEDHIENLDVFRSVSEFFRTKGLETPVSLNIGKLHGWRARAKLAIRKYRGQIKIGMFEGQSHQILEIPECKVHDPLINKITEILTSWILESKLSIYDEHTGQGLLRYLQLGVSSEKVQIVLVINTETFTKLESFESALDALWQKYPNLWHSIWVNFNTRRDNVIFGEHWKLIQGEEWQWENYLGRDVAFHPASFMQANPEMFKTLLTQLKTYIPENAVVAEFYAGGGAIGLTLVDRCQHIYFNEINKLAKLCFEESCKKLSPLLSKKLKFFSGEAGASNLLDQPGVNVVIVDPPRKGLDKILMDKILNSPHIKKLIYVSCGWKSFQKDAEILLGAGFTLEHAEAFLFFPGTDQLEILAVFQSTF